MADGHVMPVYKTPGTCRKQSISERVQKRENRAKVTFHCMQSGSEINVGWGKNATKMNKKASQILDHWVKKNVPVP